jgi:hypothetical protein
MRRIIFLMITVMFSASMAFGQNNQDPDNNNLGDPYTYLTVKAETPANLLVNIVEVTITWYTNGVPVFQQTEEGQYMGNHKWEFPLFYAPNGCLIPGNSYVKYSAKAIDDIYYNRRIKATATGTYDITFNGYNFINITPGMWMLVYYPNDPGTE